MSLVSGIQYSTEIKGRRNAFINGNFDIWQRGTSQTANLFGSADRWGMFKGGTGVTQTMSRQTFTTGQTDVPNNPRYYCRHVVTSGTDVATQARMFQTIEDVRTFSGETITISFWAKAGAALDMSLYAYQGFGTGGSPSTFVQTALDKVSLTTSWAKYEVTATIPSVSGKTVGTNEDSTLSINFMFSGGSDFASLSNNLGIQSGTFELAQIQIEKGDTATEFEMRNPAEELAMCQRYYQQNIPGTTFTGTTGMIVFQNPTAVGDTALFRATFPLNSEMRVEPTITIYSVTNGTSGSIYNNNTASDVSIGVANASVNNFTLTNQDGSAVAGDSQLRFHWVADAELT